MSTFINIDIDHANKQIMVYVASNDGLDDVEQWDRIFEWDDHDEDWEFADALAAAERHAHRLSWRIEAEIRKNYGDIT
jgi:hypothetical protein